MISRNNLILFALVLFGLSCKLTESYEFEEENDGRFSVRRDVRIRKEFTSMSFKERARFVRAYKTVSTHPQFRRRYEYLVGLHTTLFGKVHVEKQFFPWHRWYLLQFENLLRKVDSRVTIPYWDWSLRSQKLWMISRKSVWNNYPWGLGGNGTGKFDCVDKGPFSKTKWRLAKKSGAGCLRRNFMGRMPSVVAVHGALRHSVAQFKTFERKVRVFFHNELHCCIQGTMELASASNTPEFLLHHNFMDKIWYDWQNKGPEYRMKLDDNMDSKLIGTSYNVHHFMDPNNLGHFGTRVHFRDPFPGYKRLHGALGSLDVHDLKMLDSYDEDVSKSCCPRTVDERDKKTRQLKKYKSDIPVEVSLDYGDWK